MRPALLTQAAAIKDAKERSGLSRATVEKAVAKMAYTSEGKARFPDGKRAKVLSLDIDRFVDGINDLRRQAANSGPSTIRLSGRTKKRIREGALA